jgi:hypothetical protein
MSWNSTGWIAKGLAVCLATTCLYGVSAARAADSTLSPSIKKSVKFKEKKAGDTSSLITQDELDEQALEAEIDGKIVPQNSPSIYDPASGAVWQPAVQGDGTNASGDAIPSGGETVAEDGTPEAGGMPLAYGEDPALKAQKPAEQEDSLFNMIQNIFGGQSNLGNTGSLNNSGTEATYVGPGCIDCEYNTSYGMDLPPIDTSKIPGWVSLNNDSRLSDTEKCYSSMLLNAAKDHVREQYGNREKSKGQCARGVRGSLDTAGFNDGVGLGDAIQFQTSGNLEKLGFRNVMDGSMNPNNAPVGAVLVFKGPRTEEFLRNPSAYSRDEINGDLVGHVTIKSDDGYFLTDGRTPEPAVSGRTLVGVFVMTKCTKCSSDIKNQCAARAPVQ